MSRVERGTVQVTVRSMFEFSRALEIMPEELFGPGPGRDCDGPARRERRREFWARQEEIEHGQTKSVSSDGERDCGRD